MVLLAPSWDVTRGEWFHNLEIVRPDEDDHGIVQQWNKNCFGCHVSAQQNNYRPDTRTYATEWVDFGTSCERCHSPGSAHVAGRDRVVRAGVAAVQVLRDALRDRGPVRSAGVQQLVDTVVQRGQVAIAVISIFSLCLMPHLELSGVARQCRTRRIGYHHVTQAGARGRSPGRA